MDNFPAPVLLGYLSPETYLPVTSMIATVAGVLMMFGRNSLSMVVRWLRKLFTGRTAKSSIYRPHLGQTRERHASGEDHAEAASEAQREAA